MHAGKDHTLHATVEGTLAWSKDPFARKRRSIMHIIPKETPNRKFPAPPPFVFHPELYPELAQSNPEPTNFEIPKRKPKLGKKNPQVMKAKVVDEANVNRVEIKNMTPELFKFHGKSIYEDYDPAKTEELQYNLHSQAKKFLKVSR